MEHQTWLIVGLVACYPIGYVGLIVAPVAGAWLWAVLVGVAASVFPVVLTLIGLRARTSEGTAALSGFTQSVGYLIAAIGPFGMGLALRPHRRLDRPAHRADRARGPPAGRRSGGRAAVVHRGRDRPRPVTDPPPPERGAEARCAVRWTRKVKKPQAARGDVPHRARLCRRPADPPPWSGPLGNQRRKRPLMLRRLGAAVALVLLTTGRHRGRGCRVGAGPGRALQQPVGQAPRRRSGWSRRSSPP